MINKHIIQENPYLSTTFISDGEPLSKALEICKESGINYVEIGSNHCFEENYDYLVNYPFDYIIHNYFPIPNESFVLNIASFNESIRTKSIDHIKKAIDYCGYLDAKLYTFHPGFLTDPCGSNMYDTNYDFQWNENQLSKANLKQAKMFMYTALDEIIKYASIKTVNIAIETEGSFNKKDYLLMQCAEEFEEFINKYTKLLMVSLNCTKSGRLKMYHYL